jgi:hypothetical protein
VNKLDFNNFKGILALANKPETGTSIQDWCPFEGGSPLYKIVDKHNGKCLQKYQSLGWLEEDIEKFGEGITVDNHDLSTLDQMRTKDLKQIDIILLSIDALDLSKKELEKSLQKLKLRLSKLDKKYFLLQVSHGTSASSQREKFIPLAIIPSRPEIMPDQAAFEKWLETFSGFYYLALDSAFKSPIDVISSSERRGPQIGRAISAHEKAIPAIASDARSLALYYGLSKRETVALSQRAAMQEFLLSCLAENVRTTGKHHIVFDSLRLPIEDIPFRPLSIKPTMQKAKLIGLSLSGPTHDLTKEQSVILNDLGLKKGSVVIQFDKKNIRNQIESLGDTVRTVNFSAQLPRWPSSNKARSIKSFGEYGGI